MRVDEQQTEGQAGFCGGRKTAEQLFILRNILNWNSFQSIFLQTLKKVQFRVREPMETNKKVGNSKHVGNSNITTQTALFKTMEQSQWFDVHTGVKQGCTMFGFLF